MKSRILGRAAAMLACAFLLMGLGLTPAALAYAGDSEAVQPITIRIIPPAGGAAQQAEVEICITDNAGNGFQTAHVKAGNGSWQEVTGKLAQAGNRYSYVVDITENCTVYVRVAGMDGMIYEKFDDIQCFDAASNTQGTGSALASADPSAELDTTPRSPTALTPDGQGTVLDNVTSENSKEFFTFSTPDDNIFYLVIDRERDSDNVYFLNAVTESDLLSLAAKDEDTVTETAVPSPDPSCICKDKCAPGEVNTACPVCVLSWKDCTGTAPVSSTANAEPEQTVKSGGIGNLALILLVVLAAGGAGFYFKIYKPRKDLDHAEDLEELTGGDEKTINEDEEPAAMPEAAYKFYEEPDEPDYPEDEPEDGE